MSKKGRTKSIIEWLGFSLYAVYMFVILYYALANGLKYNMSYYELVTRVVAIIAPLCMFMLYKIIRKKLKAQIEEAIKRNAKRRK